MPKSARIVLVEDDEDIPVVVEKALRGSGDKVFSAGDGGKGPQLVKQKRPEVVVLDLMMPRMHCVRGALQRPVTAARGAPGDIGNVPPGGRGAGAGTRRGPLSDASVRRASLLDTVKTLAGDRAQVLVNGAAMDRIVSSTREYMNERGTRFHCFAAADNMLVRI